MIIAFRLLTLRHVAAVGTYRHSRRYAYAAIIFGGTRRRLRFTLRLCHTLYYDR